MKDSSIGIKVADGSLYPVLEEGFQGRKRLVVTTVRDNQTAVQIDLYRGPGEASGDAGGAVAETAEYIGSLIIDNIPLMEKGQPEVEVVLGLDVSGNLEATASDRVTGEIQSLSVSLESLSPESTYEIPEFAIEDSSTLSEDMTEPGMDLEEEFLTGDTYPIGSRDRRREHLERRRRSPLLLVLFVVAALLLLAVLALLIYRGVGGSGLLPLWDRAAPAAEDGGRPAGGAPAAESNAASAGQEASSSESPAGGPAAAQPEEPPPTAADPPVRPVASGPATAAPVGPAGPATAAGVWYKIVWGDTLWDISATYYRNPWLYPRIARANQIKDPDLIIAGTKIFIPKN